MKTACCKLCQKFGSDAGGSEPWDRVLFASANFVVVPTVGSILPGWLLIVPREHFLCFGAMGDGLLCEAIDLRDEVARVQCVIRLVSGGWLTLRFRQGENPLVWLPQKRCRNGHRQHTRHHAQRGQCVDFVGRVGEKHFHSHKRQHRAQARSNRSSETMLREWCWPHCGWSSAQADGVTAPVTSSKTQG